MERSWNERDIDLLINTILTREDSVPNFALLLGSGASITSSVDSADEMINDWRRALYRRSGTPRKYTEWLDEQPWHNNDDEYAILFELMYDQPPLRRTHIENRLRKAHPSWGYVYLTNLLDNRIFNVVFTTNFDDLLNEACFLYSEGVRPIVCAHDSAVSGIRVTSPRPKIIKLHGDFLFDNIKNTVRELETLEDNMKRKFMQFAQEYGLVVVGYSGRDRSVMDTLDILIQREEYFKQGIYWCELGEAQQRTVRLNNLLRRDRVYPVKIPGFDEFMAELHHKAGLKLPKPIVNPLQMSEGRARLFVDVHPSVERSKMISQDIRKVLHGIADIMTSVEVPAKVKAGKKPEKRYLGDRLPTSLRAVVIRQQKGLEDALREMKKAYKEDPQDVGVAYELADILARLRRKKELQEFILDEQCPVEDYNKSYFLLHADNNEGAIEMADRALSQEPDGGIEDHVARINRAIALKRLGRTEEMEAELKIIENEAPSDFIRTGIAALRNEKGPMLSLLETALKERLLSPDDVEMFVVFGDYWEDEDLLKLLDKWR